MCQQPFNVCAVCGMMTAGNWISCPAKAPCHKPMSYVAQLQEDECGRCMLRKAGDPACGPGGDSERGCWRMFWKVLECSMRKGDEKIGDGGSSSSSASTGLAKGKKFPPRSSARTAASSGRKVEPGKRKRNSAAGKTGSGRRRSNLCITDRMKRLRLDSASSDDSTASAVVKGVGNTATTASTKMTTGATVTVVGVEQAVEPETAKFATGELKSE